MEFKKCNRCGNFYITDKDICPKCTPKDNLEQSTFKNYIEQNGYNSIDNISTATGISQKNLNRFLGYEGFEDYKKNISKFDGINLK